MLFSNILVSNLLTPEYNSIQKFSDIIEDIGSFCWSLIKFIYYGARTLISMIIKLFTTIFDLLGGFFEYLLDTFDQLSLYMGDYVVYLMYVFVFILVVIVFQFIFRLFTGKYAIFNKKK